MPLSKHAQERATEKLRLMQKWFYIGINSATTGFPLWEKFKAEVVHDDPYFASLFTDEDFLNPYKES